jgi:autotransporter passenger strand-loop-strand repeat protein
MSALAARTRPVAVRAAAGKPMASSAKTLARAFSKSGGDVYVYGGASGTTVSSGGAKFVQSGGNDSGTTLSGGSINGTLNFASSGLLIINQASNFGAGALVAGFNTPNDVIDLTNISFASSNAHGLSPPGKSKARSEKSRDLRAIGSSWPHRLRAGLLIDFKSAA